MGGSHHDTAIREGQSEFPQTAWSLLARLKDPSDPRVREYLERMVSAYWRPVYKYVRIAWKRSNEDAKDLTQAFFAHVLEGSLLGSADPERGNFRKLLMTSLKNFLSNEVRTGQALKRGGGKPPVSMSDLPDDAWPGAGTDPSDAFETQWARELLERSIQKLPERLRFEAFMAFRRFHLEQVSVRDLARELHVTEAQAGHYLQDARAALRRIVTEEIREYVQDEAEISRELDLLFRAWK